MLGGAFNPPHVGHLQLAESARGQLGLDVVLLVPTGEAPHKRIEADPGREVRLRMTELAVDGADGVEVSSIEVEREGPSYTYRTLELLREAEPDRELTFLMGADVAAGLERWERPERVVELARLGVAARAETDRSEAEAALEALGATDRTDWIDMPICEVSSTRVREAAAAGRLLREMVPAGVADLIETQGIYS